MLLQEIQSLSPAERWEILEALNEKESVFVKCGTLCVDANIKPYQKAICSDCQNEMIQPPQYKMSPPVMYSCLCKD